jgi:hypothetical protein
MAVFNIPDPSMTDPVAGCLRISREMSGEIGGSRIIFFPGCLEIKIFLSKEQPPTPLRISAIS